MIDKKDHSILNGLKVFTSLYGFPSLVHSDNGSEYKNSTVQGWFEDLGTEWRFGVAYTPFQQGGAERKILTLKRCLFKKLQEANLPITEWSKHIHMINLAINLRDSHILNGESPYSLVYGHSMILNHNFDLKDTDEAKNIKIWKDKRKSLDDLYEPLSASRFENNTKNLEKKNAGLHLEVKGEQIPNGTKVLLANKTKQPGEASQTGPYLVQSFADGRYTLTDLDKDITSKRIASRDMLSVFKDDSSNEWPIFAIKDSRKRNRIIEYLIDWGPGWSNTWEPAKFVDYGKEYDKKKAESGLKKFIWKLKN